MLGGICITKKSLPVLGDNNNDNIIDVIDIIVITNYILDNLMLAPYQLYSSNINNDDVINIVDIVDIVNIILED